MRTNIDIDDELLGKAMQAGPYTTKRETVEAGLRLLARQAAYREILKWEGKLKWEGDDAIDWTTAAPDDADAVVPQLAVQERAGEYRVGAKSPVKRVPAARTGEGKRRAGR